MTGGRSSIHSALSHGAPNQEEEGLGTLQPWSLHRPPPTFSERLDHGQADRVQPDRGPWVAAHPSYPACPVMLASPGFLASVITLFFLKGAQQYQNSHRKILFRTSTNTRNVIFQKRPSYRGLLFSLEGGRGTHNHEP